MTDSKAQQADSMTAFAAILGILGVGIGWWWMDAVAALFISVSILNGGCRHIKTAALDLMDRYPEHLGKEQEDETVDQVLSEVRSRKWVQDARVRFRESNRFILGRSLFYPKEK